MSWKHKVVAAARLAAAQAQEATKEFQAKYEHDPLMQEAEDLAARARTGLQRVSATIDELTSGAGATEAGEAVGARARSLAGAARKMPILGAPMELLKERHGLAELATAFAADRSAVRALWLAEAMARVKADAILYKKTRSVISPTFAARQRLIGTVLGLGAEEEDDVQVRLLKYAYVGARKQLQAVQVDSEALHVAARCTCARGCCDPPTRP
jgi:hypothetical protein